MIYHTHAGLPRVRKNQAETKFSPGNCEGILENVRNFGHLTYVMVLSGKFGIVI